MAAPRRTRNPEAEAEQLLMHELEDAVGSEAAAGMAGKLDLARRRSLSPALTTVWSNRLPIAVVGVTAVVIGGFLTVLLGGWWWLAVAVGIHALGTVAIVWLVMRLLSDVEAPSPTVTAALEARGVRDPEGELNRLIAEAADREGEGRVGRVLGEDAGEVSASDDGDGAEAVARQQAAWTPSGSVTTPAPAGRDGRSPDA
ncbi:MAG TPA: hypothetical protein VEQ61_01490 [Thermoleophilaceae bacterium]|nr:hypothetical protein [Thermoleophilaceae bacterium]